MSCNIFVDMAVACNYCEDDEPMCGPCAIKHVIDFRSPEVGAKLLPYETGTPFMYMSKGCWWHTARDHLQRSIDDLRVKAVEDRHRSAYSTGEILAQKFGSQW